MAETPRRKLTPPEVAQQLGVGPDKVHRWIRTGELRAINLATTPTGRPRYAIDVADLVEFERGRQVLPPTQPAPRRRRRSNRNVIEFC